MGKLFDFALTAEDKDMFKKYVKAYATSSIDCDLSYLLRNWDEAKSEYLYNMMGGNLILSKAVEFHKGEDELMTDMGNMLSKWNDDRDDAAIEFYDALMKAVRHYLLDEKSNARDIWYKVDDCIFSHCALVSNRVTEYGECIFPTPDGKEYKILKGTKVMKVLAKLADMFHVDGFEEFRLAHSRVLNQKKLTGTMNISIHPMDYATMSDNDCGWSSCMSWQEDGCYRQGTVEMMNSNCVVVAYLASNNDMYVPGNYRWNSKKWRQLFVVDRGVISNVKAYPYRNDNLTLCVIDWLKELATKAGLSTYTEKNYNFHPGRAFNVDECGDREFIVDFSTGYMYNDFCSSREDQFLALGRETMESDAKWFDFNYSGYCECLKCGSIDCDYDGNEGCLVCEDCEPHSYCSCCDERIYDGDEYWLDGQCFCEYCYDEHCAVDFLTGDTHYDGNMMFVKIADEKGKIIFSNITIPIYNEYNNDLVKKFIREYLVDGATIYDFQRSWRSEYFVKISDIKPEKLLDIYNNEEFGYYDDFETVEDIEATRISEKWDQYGTEIDREVKRWDE